MMGSDRNFAEKQLLLDLFAAGVQAVRGEVATLAALSGLRADEALPDDVAIVAIGKAAAAMMAGALQAMPDWCGKGLVITKYGHLDATQAGDPRLYCIESAHPLPDQHSLQAGSSLLEFIRQLQPHQQLLVLMSGGASALVEVLPEATTLADLTRVNSFLLGGGYDILTMNRVRRALSCIKGGKLIDATAGRPVLQLLISDVPGDQPMDIGSGLLVHAPTLLPGDALYRELPEWLCSLLASAPAAPEIDDPRLQQVESRIIASSALAQQAVAQAAAEQGLTVIQGTGALHMDVHEAADRVCATLQHPDAPPGVYIWGGEPTLNLPSQPGRGGRNQHLALLLAERLRGHSDLWVLCCGTDGTDGPTADAGGLIDGSLLLRHNIGAERVLASLEAADAGNLLDELNALVTTGPTGTNVMDLIIAIKAGS